MQNKNIQNLVSKWKQVQDTNKAFVIRIVETSDNIVYLSDMAINLKYSNKADKFVMRFPIEEKPEIKEGDLCLFYYEGDILEGLMAGGFACKDYETLTDFGDCMHIEKYFINVNMFFLDSPDFCVTICQDYLFGKYPDIDWRNKRSCFEITNQEAIIDILETFQQDN